MNKPITEIGRFVATLGALWGAMEIMDIAKKDDLRDLEIRMIEARARLDVFTAIYQQREGVFIFTHPLEEDQSPALVAVPAGPEPPG